MIPFSVENSVILFKICDGILTLWELWLLNFQVAYNFGQNGTIPSISNSNRSPKHNEDNNTFLAIPKRYRKIDIKYNKLGNDDLHYDQYNKTGFSGLEAILPNSYCNPTIQVIIKVVKIFNFDYSIL